MKKMNWKKTFTLTASAALALSLLAAHSGLPGSHLQPQDHPAARGRTGFVPVVRTVPAAAPEEQRKDEQDTYRMTDRKHGATGNAG